MYQKLSRNIDEDEIILFAFRYSIGKRSSLSSICVEYLLETQSVIRSETKKQIVDEIYTAISKNKAGNNDDVEGWKRVIEVFSKIS